MVGPTAPPPKHEVDRMLQLQRLRYRLHYKRSLALLQRSRADLDPTVEVDSGWERVSEICQKRDRANLNLALWAYRL
jgi:hypothetical protein